MRRLLKGLGYVAAGLVVLVLCAAAGIYGFSEARYRKQYAITPPAIAIPTDSAAIARGAHLANSIAGCAECHGQNLAGAKIIDDPAFATIYGLNLTRGKGGVGGTLSDADYVRAIRHGVSPSGRALKIMPSSDYMNLSDADLAAIIAYVKARPAVDNEVPAITMGPIARALFVAGKLPILHAERVDHDRLPQAAVPAAPTAGYGAYLASFGCKGCHGPAFAGGPIIDGPPAWPPAANLTPAGPTRDWTEADFIHLWRTGKRPDGSPVNEAMPWKASNGLTDDELHAIYLYIRTLPAVPTPGVGKPQQTASRM